MNQVLKHATTGRWRLGLFLSAVCALLWGVLPVVMKVVIHEMDAASMVWIRMLVAASALGCVLVATGGLKNLMHLRRNEYLLLFITACCMSANFFLFIDSLNFISPGNAQLFIQLGPVFMALGAMAFFGERFSLRQWIAQIFLILGFGLFFSDQLRHQSAESNQYLFGILLVVFAAVTWAAYALLQKQLHGRLSSAQVLFCLYSLSCLFFFPFAKPSLIGGLSSLAFAGLVFSSINTIFAYGAFAESLRHWHASRISAVLAITPIVTLCTAAAANLWDPTHHIAELIDPIGFVGAVVVVICSAVIALAKSVPG